MSAICLLTHHRQSYHVTTSRAAGPVLRDNIEPWIRACPEYALLFTERMDEGQIFLVTDRRLLERKELLGAGSEWKHCPLIGRRLVEETLVERCLTKRISRGVSPEDFLMIIEKIPEVTFFLSVRKRTDCDGSKSMERHLTRASLFYESIHVDHHFDAASIATVPVS